MSETSQTTDTTKATPVHTLDSLLAFYDQANALLKFSLLIVVLWPLSALAAAMIFHGQKVQTIVPLVDMIPVAAVFFLVIGAPFGLMILLRDPTARKGFIFLAGLIGIELAIGVYLAVIPVSSDMGLVPLLTLGSMALFFLWVAKFARVLRILLTIGLVVVTIIFIVGGRTTFVSAIKSAATPVVHQNFGGHGDISSFTIPLASDIWTQEVTAPRAWTAFNLTVNRNFDDPSAENPWFAYRCSGTSGQLIDTGTVYKTGQTYPSALFASCTGPIQFRGHANVLFEQVFVRTIPEFSTAPSQATLNPVSKAPNQTQPSHPAALPIDETEFLYHGE